MVARLLIIGDLRDFYGYNSPSLLLLHRKAGTQRRLHLSGQTTEILLQLARIAHAHDLKASVLVQAEKQDSSAWPVGEGRKRLEEVRRCACVGGLGFHALKLSMTTTQFGDEALHCFLVHLEGI
jgi:hypothetical protein